MSKPDAPKFVTALFSFKGKNNDEVCLLAIVSYYSSSTSVIAFKF